MKLVKSNLIKLFCREYGYRQNDISIVYDDMLDFLTKHLKKGHALRVSGLIHIYPEITPPFTMKTPQGEEVNIPYRARLRVKLSPLIKEGLKYVKEIDGIPLEELYEQKQVAEEDEEEPEEIEEAEEE